MDPAERSGRPDYSSIVKGFFDPDRDRQVMIDSLAGNVVVQVTVPGGPSPAEIVGRAAVTEFFERLPSVVEFRQGVPRQFFSAGDRVVVVGRETYLLIENRVSLNGMDYAMVFDFEDGRVSKVLVMQDFSALNRAQDRDG